jgi:hypothetical protein
MLDPLRRRIRSSMVEDPQSCVELEATPRLRVLAPQDTHLLIGSLEFRNVQNLETILPNQQELTILIGLVNSQL